MRKLAATALVMLAAGACTQPAGTPPSLAPRAAETIDPRLPIGDSTPVGPVDSALAGRLAELVAQARAGDAAFQQAASDAERLIGAAGAAQSESWIAAQQAVSVAVAVRAPTTRAMGDIDELAATGIARSGFIAPADRLAIEAAAAEVWEIASAQGARIDAMQARLRS